MSIYPDGPPEGRPLPDRVRQDIPRLSGPDFRPLQDAPLQPQQPNLYWPTDIRPVTGYLPSPPYLPAQPVYIARPTPPPTSGLAVTSLVLGLVGACLVGLGPFGVLALIFGASALPAINRGHRDGKGIAVAGLVLGIVQVVLWVVLLISIGAASPGLR